MIIGLDIDDTISRHPSFFSFLSSSLIAAGHSVVVITFREERDTAVADLSEWGIQYTKLVTSSLDAQLEHGVYEWKGQVCAKHRVEVFFDDDPKIMQQVDPSVVCFMTVDPAKRNLPCAAGDVGESF